MSTTPRSETAALRAASRPDASKSGSLVAEVVAVSALEASAREAMWQVFARYYAEVDRARFERDLDKKDDVILLIDGGDRSIQGFSTLEIYRRAEDGRNVIAVFSGDTIIDEAYWGQKALHRTFVRYVVMLKLRNPTVPVYWFLISKGYKTYLLLSRNFTTYWPRHDRETPRWEQGLLDFLANDKYPDDYVPEAGVLRFAECEGRLKGGVAPIAPSLLDHPDIKFFLRSNPGHALGEELCCLGKVDAGLWLNFTKRLVEKTAHKSMRAARRIWAMATTSLL